MPKNKKHKRLILHNGTATWTFNRHQCKALYLIPFAPPELMTVGAGLISSGSTLVLLLLICLQAATKHPVTGPQFVRVCLR